MDGAGGSSGWPERPGSSDLSVCMSPGAEPQGGGRDSTACRPADRRSIISAASSGLPRRATVARGMLRHGRRRGGLQIGSGQPWRAEASVWLALAMGATSSCRSSSSGVRGGRVPASGDPLANPIRAQISAPKDVDRSSTRRSLGSRPSHSRSSRRLEPASQVITTHGGCSDHHRGQPGDRRGATVCRDRAPSEVAVAPIDRPHP